MRKKPKTFTLSPRVLKALAEKAKKEQRSESQVVDMALEKALLTKESK